MHSVNYSRSLSVSSCSAGGLFGGGTTSDASDASGSLFGGTKTADSTSKGGLFASGTTVPDSKSSAGGIFGGGGVSAPFGGASAMSGGSGLFGATSKGGVTALGAPKAAASLCAMTKDPKAPWASIQKTTNVSNGEVSAEAPAGSAAGLNLSAVGPLDGVKLVDDDTAIYTEYQQRCVMAATNTSVAVATTNGLAIVDAMAALTDGAEEFTKKKEGTDDVEAVKQKCYDEAFEKHHQMHKSFAGKEVTAVAASLDEKDPYFAAAEGLNVTLINAKSPYLVHETIDLSSQGILDGADGSTVHSLGCGRSRFWFVTTKEGSLLAWHSLITH